MAQTIKLKRSSVSGNTPSTSDLELGEVAINTYDGKMFIKKNDGSDSIVEIGGGSGTVTEAFKTIAVSGQSNVVADSATDTLTLVAGSNMTITTNASGDTITFASSGGGGSQNLFSTFAVSGQNNVVADSTTDTLTFVAGSGITLTTDNSADSITIAATASAITVQDEGSALSTAATTLNFVGAGVTATGTGATKTITIPGGSGNSFGTFAVSGQGSVVADQANDTLTLVAGSNVTLTTSAAGDSITIASSGGGGGASVDAGASITEFKYDVSSSTTSFSGSDANSNTLAYTAGAVQVYLNGILLDPATDYTAANGTSIVLTDAASSGDDLQIIAFNRKILNANTTVNTFTGDGTTTAFTLSTDPVNENNTNIFIDGVYQSKSNYSVSGTTLTFSTAPPDTSAIEVSLGFQQASISSTLDFDDNAILRLGTGNDLQLLHDGSNSIIKDTGTGDLQIGASTLEVKNAALNETMIKAIEDGAVELYHNNAKKLETVTGGVTVTGTVTATTFSGDLSGTINTATTGTTQSASDNSTKIATTAYVDTAVTNLVDSAPGTLNTLNELAAALGDDANFSTTITNSLATKVGQTATTGAATIPAGTTAQRPGSPAAGQFRYNSTLSQFEGYTSSWGAIGGGGTNTFTTDIFTANGSTTAFTLTQAVSSPNDCIVHIDGIYQTPTDAYTVSGTTLTFSSAPANTRKIVVYSVRAGVSGNNLNIETFSGDGSATSFTMSINPINENNTIVHIDGVYQQKTSYSTSGTTLSFSAAPANGTTIEVATFTQTEINVPVNDTIDTVHIKDDAVTSAKLGGNLTLPGNLSFADNARAVFGAGSDLEILSNGTDGLIRNGNATGEIRMESDDRIIISDRGFNEVFAVFNDDDDVKLYHNGNQKLATTSTGIDITGSVVSDGLTSSGPINLTAGALAAAGNAGLSHRSSDNKVYLQAGTGGFNILDDQQNTHFAIDSAGVSSFYGKVGIGGSTITDSNLLNLQGSGISVNVGVVFNDTNTSKIFGIQNGGSALKFFDYTASAERMRIDSSGNVGIGTSSITTFSGYKTLHFKNESGNAISLAESDGGIIAQTICDDATGVTIGSRSNHILRITTNDAERMRLDSSGRVSFGPDAADIQIDPASTNSGNNLIYMRGNASNDKSSIQLNHYGVADYHIGVGHVGSGKFNIANDQTGNDFVIDTAGNVGIGTSSPSGKLDVVGATATPLVLELSTGNSNCDITMQSANTSSATRLRNGTNDFQIHTSSGENLRINSSANSGHLQMGAFGITGLNTTAAIHGVGNDAALVLSNGNLSTSNSSYGWAGRGNRYLTSNGTNWDFDGRDPALVIGQNTASDNRGQGIGIILHNESTTNGHYGPIVGWGTKSESNSYNTMYAYIVGKKTGSGVDTNWSKGELQFDTAGLKPNGSNAYMTDTPSMIIDDSGAVTKPHQPHIRLYGNNATRVQTQGSAFTAYVNFAISSQRGITFNSGNGLITVPVAGTYLIQYSFYLWMDNVGHGVNHSIALYRNSSMQQESIHEMVGISGSQLWDNTLSNSLILDCAAGDTIRFGGNADIYGGTVHTNASVYLLG